MDHMSGMPGMDGMGDMKPSPKGHSGGGMMMNTFFVAATPNMPLWFSGWTPTTAGATFGACLGLFALTMVVKLLGALRHQAHLAWSMNKWHDSGLARHPTMDKNGNEEAVTSPLRATRPPVPWAAGRDIPRGILAGLHVALEYFLMLAVMTYNVYYFIAIVLGHFAGEVAFGRWASVQGAHC